MTSFPKLSYACPIPWDQMRGDEKSRYCAKCSRSVINLSLLTEAQRHALTENTPASGLCVVYYRRLTGEFVTAEKPLKTETPTAPQFGVAALSAGAMAVAVACMSDENTATRRAGERLADAYLTTRDNVVEYSAKIVTEIERRLPGHGKELHVKEEEAVMMLGMVSCPTPPVSTSPDFVSPPVISLPSIPPYLVIPPVVPVLRTDSVDSGT